MAIRHVIKIYSGFDTKNNCEYRTELDSRDYNLLEELLEEIEREIIDNEEMLEGNDDTD